MGEDVVGGRTRTHRRRWVLAVAVAVAATAGGLGGALAAEERASEPSPPSAPTEHERPAPIAKLRSAPVTEVSTTVVPPTTTTAAKVTGAPAEPAPPAPVAPVAAPAPPPPPVVVHDEPPAAPAPPGELAGWTRRTDLEAELRAMHGAARASAGMAPYAEQACLTSVAVRWARTMAERNMLAHNPNYVGQILACSDNVIVGENVGVGYVEAGGAAGVFDTFMASPTHRSNILDTDFELIGVGVWSSSDGTIRVAVNFGRA